MERYAHKDQVDTAFAILRVKLYELLDVPAVPDSVLDAAIQVLSDARATVNFDSEESIAAHFLNSLNGD